MRTLCTFRSVAVALTTLSASAWCACLSPSDSSPVGTDRDASVPDEGCTVLACRDGSVLLDSAPGEDASFDAADANVSPQDASSGDGAAPDAADAMNPNDLFVDEALGVDTNTGKSGSPFKTFGKAFSVATSGITVWVADGTYDPTTEGNTSALTIPDGVTVRATHPGLVIVDALVVNAAASATLSDLVFDKGLNFTASNAVAATSSVIITNLQLRGGALYNTALTFGGNVKVALTNPSFSGTLNNGFVSIKGAAEVVITGGTLDGGNTGVEAFGGGLFSVGGTSKLTLDGMTFRNTMTSAIGANGTSATTPVSITLKNATLFDSIGAADNCAAAGAIVLTKNATLEIDGSQINNTRSSAICVRDGVASHITVTIENGSSFTNDPIAIQSEPGQPAEATISVNGATITSSASAAINWGGTGSIDLQAVTMKNNASGVVVSGGSALSLRMRNSTITANSADGVQAFSSAVGALTFDLGTTASPGGNTITGNVTTGLDLHMPAGDTANAAGNTWNPGVQGADVAGHYAGGTVQAGPLTGTNFQMANAQTINL